MRFFNNGNNFSLKICMCYRISWPFFKNISSRLYLVINSFHNFQYRSLKLQNVYTHILKNMYLVFSLKRFAISWTYCPCHI